MNTTNATNPCVGDWPLLAPLPAPLALQGNHLLYHAAGPLSNFGAAMSGCCRGKVDIYDPGPAPLGCYYYCMFPLDGSQEDWAQVRDCILARGAVEQRKLRNVTTSGFVTSGRSPDLINAGASLRQGQKFGIWSAMVMGLAFAGGIFG